jgi:hypothetical protein
LHINSTVAICPPVVQLDDGGSYTSSRTQRWLWKCWLDFWARVQEDAGGYRKILVINGDLGELDTKRRSVQIITANKSTILNTVRDVLQPASWDALYIVRGTRAHVGKSAWLEEEIGKDLMAQPSDKDIASWWQIRASVEGVRFDISHHASMGRLPWNRTNSAVKMASETIWNYMVERRAEPPNIVIRSHNHIYVDAAVNGTHSYFTPAWTASTEFAYRIGFENTIANVGGLVFLCENGEYIMKHYKYIPDRERRVWQLKL